MILEWPSLAWSNSLHNLYGRSHAFSKDCSSPVSVVGSECIRHQYHVNARNSPSHHVEVGSCVREGDETSTWEHGPERCLLTRFLFISRNDIKPSSHCIGSYAKENVLVIFSPDNCEARGCIPSSDSFQLIIISVSQATGVGHNSQAGCFSNTTAERARGGTGTEPLTCTPPRAPATLNTGSALWTWGGPHPEPDFLRSRPSVWLRLGGEITLTKWHSLRRPRSWSRAAVCQKRTWSPKFLKFAKGEKCCSCRCASSAASCYWLGVCRRCSQRRVSDCPYIWFGDTSLIMRVIIV